MLRCGSRSHIRRLVDRHKEVAIGDVEMRFKEESLQEYEEISRYKKKVSKSTRKSQSTCNGRNI